jgi:hypothetical protein
MSTLRHHHFYTCEGNFTNRINRQVQFDITIDADAPYELQAIHHTTTTGPIRFKFCDLQLHWINLDEFPWPLVPAKLYGPSEVIRFAVSLPDDLNIGRKRPRFIVQLMGVKVYSE